MITGSLFLLQLRLDLWGRHQIADRLKGRGKPHGAFAGGRLVEEPLATLLGHAQLRRAVARLGHHVEPNGLPNLHQQHQDGHGPRHIQGLTRWMVGVGEGQADGLDEGPAQLDGKAAPVGGNHVHAEHDPYGAGQGGGTNHGAPDQAQLADAVDRKPIGEGLDQMHHADQEGHTCISFCAPVVLLRLSDGLEVRVGLRRRFQAESAGGGLGKLVPAMDLLLHPSRCSRGEAWHPRSMAHLLEIATRLLLEILHLSLHLCCHSRQAPLLVATFDTLEVDVGLLPRRGLAALRQHEGQAEHVVDALLLIA
mmetsp:Transcript_32096/g.51647  ORF Transcript_32096/g.51647 Transcript_32096/m.51647 type:complete len:308 (+) Transcript_32096:1306-2229(+)